MRAKYIYTSSYRYLQLQSNTTGFTFFFHKFIYFIYFWLCWVFVAARGLFSSYGKQGLLFVVVGGRLTSVASLVAEHGLQARRLQQLWLTGSRAQAQQLWRMGLVAPQRVGSSRTRARTRVPCIGWRILNHCTTREAWVHFFITFFSMRKKQLSFYTKYLLIFQSQQTQKIVSELLTHTSMRNKFTNYSAVFCIMLFCIWLLIICSLFVVYSSKAFEKRSHEATITAVIQNSFATPQILPCCPFVVNISPHSLTLETTDLFSIPIILFFNNTL